MHEIVLSAEAQRDLARLDPPTRQRVAKRIEWLSEHAGEVTQAALT